MSHDCSRGQADKAVIPHEPTINTRTPTLCGPTGVQFPSDMSDNFIRHIRTAPAAPVRRGAGGEDGSDSTGSEDEEPLGLVTPARSHLLASTSLDDHAARPSSHPPLALPRTHSPVNSDQLDELPPRKRQRRALMACFPCRRRKRCCDSSRPVCRLCEEGGYSCEWPERDKRRKRGMREGDSEGDLAGRAGGSMDVGNGDERGLDHSELDFLNGAIGIAIDVGEGAHAESLETGRLTPQAIRSIPGDSFRTDILPPSARAHTTNQSPSAGSASWFSRPIPIGDGSVPLGPRDFLDEGSYRQALADKYTGAFSNKAALRGNLGTTLPGTSQTVRELPGVDAPMTIEASSRGLGNGASARSDLAVHGHPDELFYLMHASSATAQDAGQRTTSLRASHDGISHAGEVPAIAAQGPMLGNLPLPEDHVAPSTDSLTYEYLRPFGITAIQPGLGRVQLSIRTDGGSDAGNSIKAVSPAIGKGTPSAHALAQDGDAFGAGSGLVDKRTKLPVESVRQDLLDTFFANFQGVFPFIDRLKLDEELAGRPSLGTVLMINGMCALSSRFSSHPEIVALSPLAFSRGFPFADAAKQLLIPLLGLPSRATTAALLFLSWYAFGLNSEAELWMYSGMSLRMAVDLGFHRKVSSRKNRRADRALFWSVYLLDRTLAIGTGRPTNIPDSQIDIPNPVDDHDLQAGMAFAYAVKFFILYGKVADVANGCSFWARGGSIVTLDTAAPNSPTQTPPLERPGRGAGARVQFAPSPPPLTAAAAPDGGPRVETGSGTFRPDDLAVLSQLEDEIMGAYDALPAEMSWSLDAFTAHADRGEADMFLHIHLWYHCMIAILYREPLTQARIHSAGISITEAKEIQQSAATTVREIAEAIPEQQAGIILRNPFINQCFYTAASTWVSELTALQQTGNKALARARSQIFSQAMRNFQSCARLLKRQSEVWSGVGWIAAALAKRSAGTSLQDMVVKRGVVDTILSEAEMRILATDSSPANPDPDSLVFDLRDDLFQTLGGVSYEFGDTVWAADGLFDGDMERLFFGLNESGYGTPGFGSAGPWI